MRILFIAHQFFARFVLPGTRFILSIFSSALRERIKFERKNLFDEACLSFRELGLRADLAFEISSEGELQQVKPLIDKYLSEGKRIELIYCSDSVENQIIAWQKKFSNQMRTLRMPLIAYKPGDKRLSAYRWLSAPILLLCRYDFFPELIFYAKFKAKFFVLLAATLKNHRQNFWNNKVYTLFDMILTNTQLDKQKFQSLFPNKAQNIFEHDFRVLQIQTRLDQANLTLKSKLKNLAQLQTLIGEVSFSKRIILGSFWPAEGGIFSDSKFIEAIKNREYLCLVVPHLLEQKSLIQIQTEILKHSDIPVHFYIDEEAGDFAHNFKQRPGIVVIVQKGVLLELYPDFAHAYVGGGFGRSVHSLLEPYLAGCHLYCGPKVHRSTEYDVILSKSQEQIQVIDETHQLYKRISSNLNLDFALEIRKDYVEQTQKDFLAISKKLEMR
mgnify:CR=1 FL=1